MIHAKWFVAILGIGSALQANPAQAAKKPLTRSDKLFSDAVAKMNAKDYDAACPMLKESYQLDPTPGVLFTLAFCEYETSKLIGARSKFAIFLKTCEAMPAAQQERFRERIIIAGDKLNLLAKEIPMVTLTLPSSVPTGTQVFLDDREIQNTAFARPMEVEVGNHIVRVEVPERFPLSQKIRLGRAERISHEVKVPDLPIRPELENTAQKPTTALRIGGFAALGLGGAGLATWGITGGWGLALNSTVSKYCTNEGCDKTGWDAYTKGQTVLNIASIGLGVGIGGALAGTVMLLVNRKRESTDAVQRRTQVVFMDMGLAGAGVGVKGVFR